MPGGCECHDVTDQWSRREAGPGRLLPERAVISFDKSLHEERLASRGAETTTGSDRGPQLAVARQHAVRPNSPGNTCTLGWIERLTTSVQGSAIV